MTETTTIARAQILVTVRDEARKILEQLGPAGVKSLQLYQKEVEKLSASQTEQAAQIKELQKAMEQQGRAAKTAGQESTEAAKAAATSAKGATAATDLWTFSVKTLDRVWKGLKSALIIAPLLAIAQQLLSALTEGVMKLLGFGQAAEDVTPQVSALADSMTKLRDGIASLNEVSARARNTALLGLQGSEIDALTRKLSALDAVRKDVESSQTGAFPKDVLRAVIPDPTASVPGRNQFAISREASDLVSGKGGMLTLRDALAVLDEEAARTQARLDELKTAQASVTAGASDAGAMYTVVGSQAEILAGQYHFTAEQAGEMASQIAILTTSMQADAATTTQASGVHRDYLSTLQLEFAAAKEMAAQHQRDTSFEKSRIALASQLNLTTDEAMQLRRDQLTLDEAGYADMLKTGQLTQQQYETLIGLRERLFRDNGTPSASGQAEGVGVSALATAFSDIATNAQTAKGAVTQFFASVLKGLADVAAQNASKAIFSYLFGAAANSGSGSGGDSLNSSGSGSQPIFEANGGILSAHAFASGGIANQPTAAIFAEAGMNEAFVPLPDGKTIPVTMSGGGGGPTINVYTTVQAIDRSDFDAHLDRHGKRIAEIVAGKMATHRGLRNSTRETVRGGR